MTGGWNQGGRLEEQEPPTADDYCADADHPYYGDDDENGLCYCGMMVYPKGGAHEQ